MEDFFGLLKFLFTGLFYDFSEYLVEELPEMLFP